MENDLAQTIFSFSTFVLKYAQMMCIYMSLDNVIHLPRINTIINICNTITWDDAKLISIDVNKNIFVFNAGKILISNYIFVLLR